jgi:hypothetical protein
MEQIRHETEFLMLICRTEFKIPDLAFNEDDEQYNADRRSCLGKYRIHNGLPLNPMGRTGITGRGLLNYWGPNHVIEAVFTRFVIKKNTFFSGFK